MLTNPAAATATAKAELTTEYRLAEIEQLDELSLAMQQRILHGEGMREMLAELAEATAKPALFDDFTQQLVAYAPGRHLTDAQLLERWEHHVQQPHGAKGGSDCVFAPVQLRDEQWGTVHLLMGDEVSTDFEQKAVERAALNLTLWMLTRRESTSLIDTARSEFIADLWRGRRWSHDMLLQRSRSVGADLERPVLLGLAIRLGGTTAGERVLLQTALERLRKNADHHDLSCMAAVVESTCLGIVGMSRQQAEAQAGEQLATTVLTALGDRFGDVTISIGLSREGSVGRLRKLLTEAVDAGRHGAEVVRASGLYRSSDLGLLSLLGNLAEGPELQRYVEDELGAVLGLSPVQRTPLLETLRAFLDSGGNKTVAAKQLHIERRTLYYRIERLETLLDNSLDAAATRLRLQVALQGLEVLRQIGVQQQRA